MNTTQVINHAYSYRPRTEKAEAHQTNMNAAMLKACIVKVNKEGREQE